MARNFPLIPKSSRALEEGDFWAIPLVDGGFGCGRVIAHMPRGMPGAMRGFLGGLLDWYGAAPPTSEGLAGCKTTDQGVMHILAITSTGGAVLGNRPLHLDGIEPFIFISGQDIQRGFDVVRPATKDDRGAFPNFAWWGYGLIAELANRKLARLTVGSA